MGTTIGSLNLVIELGDTEGVTLADGTYTAGTLITELVDGTTGALTGEWGLAVIDGSTRTYVLLEDVTTATDGKEAVGATGTFNLNKITFEGTQTYDNVKAHLQKFGIFLKTQGV